MELVRYVVDAVVLEGRSCREVARAHGVSKSRAAALVARLKRGGYEAIAPRSKAARKIANRSSDELEERVVRLRKDQGFDAGAHTIHYHLACADYSPPSPSTIWRILKRRGFVAPEPHKRPKSSFISFEARLPNEMWQSDGHLLRAHGRHQGRDPELLRRLRRIACVSLAPHRVGFVGFGAFETAIPKSNSVQMLDFCWISRHVEHLFASCGASKVPVDLLFRVVGGDGFEPPTPAL